MMSISLQTAVCWMLIVSLYANIAEAQVPAVCSDIESLTNKKCCPDPSEDGTAGECSSNNNRGTCVDVSTICYTSYEEDSTPEIRLNWPTHYFTQMCKCNGRYGGYDCSECQFGWGGDNCDTKLPLRTRSSITAKTPAEWTKYNEQLKVAKNTNSRYAILVPTNDSDLSTAIVRKITVFDLFSWIHEFSAKTNQDYLESGSANDYAHESAGFPTWHRLFLLMLEREIQLAVDDPTFSLSYWDWTNFEGQSDWIELIFNDQKLGGYTENGAVTGEYYGAEQWQTVCWFKDPNNGSTCDPEDTRGIYPLIRCPSNPSCTAAEGLFPKEQDASRALYNYNVWRDTSGNEPYAVFNKYAKLSFGNALEGFDANPNEDIYPFDPRLTTVTIANINLTRYLHNTGHIIVGIGDFTTDLSSGEAGTMGSVGASPNDPIFYNHHTMVDCLLEKWLLINTDEPYVGPVGERQFAGHGAGDCIVPFMPLYTHMDMYQTADNFGYSCDLRDFPPPEEPKSGTAHQLSCSNCVLTMLSVAMVLFATFAS